MTETEVPDEPLLVRQIRCAKEGHYTLGPTGEPTPCLRCNGVLDGMGLDPRFSNQDAFARETGDRWEA